MTDLLTPKQVCDMLGICFRTLTNHINSGELPYILVGRGVVRKKRMFDPADIEAFKAGAGEWHVRLSKSQWHLLLRLPT